MTRFRFADFGERRREFTARDTTADLERALDGLLQHMGPDLDAEDLGDETFLAYAADQMADAGVPAELLDEALAWCRRGRGRIRDVRQGR